jgi:bud site selection protein 20
MGHRQRPKANSKAKRRFYKRTHLDLKNRTRDLDQIQDDLKAAVEGTKVVPDYAKEPDLPGGGAFLCMHCARHFVNQGALDVHYRTKAHKRQVKRTQEEQYTQAEAEAGAGMSAAAK